MALLSIISRHVVICGCLRDLGTNLTDGLIFQKVATA